MAVIAAELTWVTYLMRDLGVFLSQLPQLFCDNVSALHLSVNPIFHARTKHIEFVYHFVREKVAMGTLVTRYVSTHSQLVDIFTKPFPKDSFTTFRDKLGGHLHSHSSLRGHDKGNNPYICGIVNVHNKEVNSTHNQSNDSSNTEIHNQSNARLEQVFCEQGKVVDAKVVYDQETGHSHGFGFVTMSCEIELNDAIAALDAIVF
ncbi:uncharacterized protein LOC130769455 [Actinidia eriantha]|uniref:uncharacterized protein LOC130769455 n=1 Tax=Actinidia eriantha TaxID=165200 RepID=UPI0025863A85|nr:uncharacterized protein LOC130769455 [Actinidia eriantha]